VDYTPPTELASGNAVKIGTFIGVADVTIPANSKGSLDVSGIRVLDMVADEFTGSYPVNIGTEVDYDFTNQVVKVAGGGDSDVKIFVAEKLTSSTQTTLQCWINSVGS
tara:strand:- start:2988 stop:3311 length:324 start_codon:yes stop_codon:yes gene_type:complete